MLRIQWCQDRMLKKKIAFDVKCRKGEAIPKLKF